MPNVSEASDVEQNVTVDISCVSDEDEESPSSSDEVSKDCKDPIQASMESADFINPHQLVGYILTSTVLHGLAFVIILIASNARNGRVEFEVSWPVATICVSVLMLWSVLAIVLYFYYVYLKYVDRSLSEYRHTPVIVMFLQSPGTKVVCIYAMVMDVFLVLLMLCSVRMADGGYLQ